MKTNLQVGDTARVIKTDKLPGNEVAPPLTMEQEIKVKEIFTDSQGHDHIDVGIPSAYSWITSHETGEKLPKGDLIHWCHPSRFEKL